MERIKRFALRGVVTLVNNALKLQGVQLQTLGGLMLDNIEHFEPFGFTANPKPGAEALILSLGGSVGNSVVIAISDRRYRLTGLATGETALYDAFGNSIVLHQDHIAINGPSKVTVNSPLVALGGDGGQPIARVGDNVDPATHKIISGSSKVTAL